MDDLVREAQQAKSDHVIKTNSKNVKYAVQPTRSERTAYNANRALNGVNVKGNWFSRIGATASTLFGSAVTNLSKEGALGHAGKQVVKSAAVGAGFQGGLAALQGDDPWEAAKKGAFQGAMVGAGYQGLKAATHANASSIRGNLKHMGSTVADTYRAHSSAGQTYMRQNGVSDQLKRVLDANRMSRVNEAANKLNKPKKKR